MYFVIALEYHNLHNKINYSNTQQTEQCQMSNFRNTIRIEVDQQSGCRNGAQCTANTILCAIRRHRDRMGTL